MKQYFVRPRAPTVAATATRAWQRASPPYARRVLDLPLEGVRCSGIEAERSLFVPLCSAACNVTA
eukprot:1779040-Pleurochrysis_carterae.AAC.1